MRSISENNTPESTSTMWMPTFQISCYWPLSFARMSSMLTKGFSSSIALRSLTEYIVSKPNAYTPWIDDRTFHTMTRS